MRVTEYSLLMGAVWSDVMILTMYLLRNRLWFIRIFSTRTMLILYGGCFLRMCFGVEIDAVTEISLPQLNFIGDLVNCTAELGGRRVSAPAMFAAVWFMVSVALLAKIAMKYKKLRRTYTHGAGQNKAAEQILNQLVDVKQRSRVTVVTSNRVSSPCIIGLYHGVICLPEYKWAVKKLHIVLQHEYAHFKNGDLVVILLVNVFTAVFWWNAPVYLLQRMLGDVLESKADETALKKRRRSEARYYCKIMVEFAVKDKEYLMNFAVSHIEGRIRRILEKQTHNGPVFPVILLFVIVMSFLLSYIFLLQPLYVPHEVAGTAYSIEQSEDGTAAMRINGRVYHIPADEYERLSKKESQS